MQGGSREGEGQLLCGHPKHWIQIVAHSQYKIERKTFISGENFALSYWLQIIAGRQSGPYDSGVEVVDDDDDHNENDNGNDDDDDNDDDNDNNRLTTRLAILMTMKTQ